MTVLPPSLLTSAGSARISSVKRRKLLRTFIANSNVIHETKSHLVISLLISPYHTSPRFGGRFPDSRKPSGNAWHAREV
jgi:hypothetical protein